MCERMSKLLISHNENDFKYEYYIYQNKKKNNIFKYIIFFYLMLFGTAFVLSF